MDTSTLTIICKTAGASVLSEDTVYARSSRATVLWNPTQAKAFLQLTHNLNDEDAIRTLGTRYTDKVNAPEKDGDKKPLASTVFDFCFAGCIFIRDSKKSGNYFVTFPDGSTYSLLQSKLQFKVAKMWKDKTGVGLTNAQIKDVIYQVVCECSEESGVSQSVPIFSRVARSITGAYLIDLCNSGKITRVNLDGSWEVIDKSHPDARHFVHSAEQIALPIPVKLSNEDFNRALKLIWQHFPIKNETDRLKLLAWLISAMMHSSTYALLMLLGPAGSTKSAIQARLIDCSDPVNVLPGTKITEEDIALTVNTQHVVAYDNLQHIPKEVQNILCNCVTGNGSYSSRVFYSNTDRLTIPLLAPVILTAVENVVTNSDLVNRTLTIVTEAKEGGHTKSGSEYDEEWKADYPLIYSALTELMARVIKLLPEIEVSSWLRAVDLVKVGEALVKLLNGKKGTFEQILVENYNRDLLYHAQASPTVRALLQLVDSDSTLSGKEWTSMGFYKALKNKNTDRTTLFGNDPMSVLKILNSYKEALKLMNITIEVLTKKDRYGMNMVKVWTDDEIAAIEREEQAARDIWDYEANRLLDIKHFARYEAKAKEAKMIWEGTEEGRAIKELENSLFN